MIGANFGLVGSYQVVLGLHCAMLETSRDGLQGSTVGVAKKERLHNQD